MNAKATPRTAPTTTTAGTPGDRHGNDARQESRAHGTRACYVSGPYTGADPCRCQDCRDANSAYQKDRSRRAAPAFVAAGPARAHLEELRQSGVGLRTVAQRSGVSRSRLSMIVSGRVARVRPETLESIMAVFPSDAADAALVDAEAVWRMVDDLLAAGVPKVRIAEHIGQSHGLQLSSQFVSARSARLVAAMHAQWRAGALEVAVKGSPTTIPAPTPDVLARQRDIDGAVVALAEVLEERIDQRDWRTRAACRTQPTRLFFPGRGDLAAVAAAKKVCAGCGVAAECLAAHLDVEHGVFGGLSSHERRLMRAAEAAEGVDDETGGYAADLEASAG
jgi:hypothetical protein